MGAGYLGRRADSTVSRVTGECRVLLVIQGVVWLGSQSAAIQTTLPDNNSTIGVDHGGHTTSLGVSPKLPPVPQMAPVIQTHHHPAPQITLHF